MADEKVKVSSLVTVAPKTTDKVLITTTDDSGQVQTRNALVSDIRNLAASLEDSEDKAINVKIANEIIKKVTDLASEVDTSFETVNQNFTNVNNAISQNRDNITTANENMTAHEEDTDLHVTAEKQQKWDGYDQSIKDVKEIADNNTTQLKDLANPSILINGDFRKPINQRNFSRRSYTGSNWAYGIDRWVIGILDSTGQSECILNDGYISLKSKANDGCINMYTLLENPQLYYGETLTASFKYRIVEGQPNCVCTTAYNNLIKNGAFFDYNKSENKLIADGQWHVYTFTYTVSGEKVNDNFTSFLVGTGMLQKNADDDDYTWVKPTVNTQIDIEWAKLEIGSKATPFVPRPYGEELALCQRYYYRWGNERARYRAVGINGNQLFFFVPLPTTLRIIPTINNAFSINTLSGAGVSDFTFAVNIVPMGMIVHATKSTHGMSDGQLMLSDDGSLDAEIY